jgi:hypothetical protein
MSKGDIAKSELLLVFRIVGISEPEQEYRFHPTRRWRFDFAWPDHKVAIEWEGIVSIKSGHTTLKGYTSNCEKYNEATLLGWSVYRFTALHQKTYVIELLQKVFSP